MQQMNNKIVPSNILSGMHSVETKSNQKHTNEDGMKERKKEKITANQ